MDYQAMLEQDIRAVMDNYEDTHARINAMIAETNGLLSLSHTLAEWYDSAIDEALRAVPENSDGYRLIQQITCRIPLSVFEEIAAAYLDPMP